MEKLYKYFRFNEYTILNFENNGIYAPTRDKLNDPFDSLFGSKIDGRKTKYQELIKLITREYPNSFTDLSHNNDNLFHIIKFYKIDLGLIIEKYKSNIDFTEYYLYISQKMKIISFTTRKVSNLMWAHYSESFHGLMIEYLVSQGNSNLEELIDVDYKKRNLVYDGVETINKFVFGYKSKDWSYEKEKRIIVDLDKGENYYKKVKIESIYFGYRFFEDLKDKKDAIKLLNRLVDYLNENPKIKLYFSKLNEQEQKIKYIKVDLKLLLLKISENTL